MPRIGVLHPGAMGISVAVSALARAFGFDDIGGFGAMPARIIENVGSPFCQKEHQEGAEQASGGLGNCHRVEH